MRDQLLEMFIFETSQLLEQLEEIVLEVERENALTSDNINEIFRAMHTIKGSSAMMMYENISKITHAVEDMFFFIRENKPEHIDYSRVCDIVLQTSDYTKGEIAKITNGLEADGPIDELLVSIRAYLEVLRQGDEPAPAPAAPKAAAPAAEEPALALPVEEGCACYEALVHFDDNCQMENIRAFGLVHALKDHCIEIDHQPEDLLEEESASFAIVTSGFRLTVTTKEPRGVLERVFEETMFLKTYTLTLVGGCEQGAAPAEPAKAADAPAVAPAQAAAEAAPLAPADTAQPAAPVHVAQVTAQVKAAQAADEKETLLKSVKQSQISVNINKLDALMDLVGEIVINEAMVTHSPDLVGLQLDNFSKAARQLRKLTDELQDLVMSVRMIPVANTFHKMTRIVRDMSKKLDKDAELTILGEETEVDKNIIDNLSDPLMHLIRNSMDHGLETREERLAAGKPSTGRVTLEAVNTGGDVLITVRDDGRGLDRDKLIRKAREQGILTKAESELTDREAFLLILQPGFSTKDAVTEFSGRGVGMDVVKKNIEKVGGTVSIDSKPGQGTTVTIKIPLTLAIVDGMMFAVGKSTYTVSTTSIREAFRPADHNILVDPEGHEMIMIRGNCYPIVRLYQVYDIPDAETDLAQGIILVVEADDNTICLFADRLLGEQQVVVKPLPYYLMRFDLKGQAGIGGCTILGDGSISLILDTSEVMRCML